MTPRAALAVTVPRGRSPGFTLVELLLVTALLVLLLGAVAFNFSTVQRNAELDEGASQFESLLRYARAHAASTGCRVRVVFEEDAGDGLLVPLGNFSVTWEPDPLGHPEEFVPLPETTSLVASILDVISIENVRPPVAAAPAGSGSGTGAGAGAGVVSPVGGMGSSPGGAGEQGVVDAGLQAGGFGFAPIVFFPDGSADPVEITIAARSGEDSRRMVLKMSGLTGNIRRRTYVEATLTDLAEDELDLGADGDGARSGDSSAPSSTPSGEGRGAGREESR